MVAFLAARHIRLVRSFITFHLVLSSLIRVYTTLKFLQYELLICITTMTLWFAWIEHYVMPLNTCENEVTAHLLSLQCHC